MIIIQPVVLSGGAGTRLWPASRAAQPKQFLPLTGDMSLMEATLQRISVQGYRPALMVGSRAHRDSMAQIVAAMDYNPGGYIHEPIGRNTAAAIALAAIYFEQQDTGETVLLVMPADHHIPDEAAFHAVVATGATAADEGLMVTFGIRPDRPETGYGYIVAEKGQEIGGALPVAQFLEKPSKEKALSLIEAGSCYWNSGIFMFRVDILLGEMSRHCPDILETCRRAFEAGVMEADVLSPDEAMFQDCSSLPLDIAVMERTDKAVVIPADMEWNDVGSWQALWSIADHDGEGNAVRGDVMLEDTSGSYVHADHRLVVLVGLDDMVVVETEEAVLVTQRDRVQDVKAIVERLKASHRDEV
ncbi:MAG: mannose-1-phosphate guanylyltransferase/mannose-6-phosphate isomerase [Parvularculales bacterium]